MKPIDLTKNFSELNGVRGIAILLVFLFHCLPSIRFSVIDYLLKVKESFWIGVDLFFVLSGFLITRILIGMKESDKKYRVFYGRRTLRILPLYFLALFIVFFVLRHNLRIFAALEGTAPKVWYYLYAYNLYVFLNNGWANSGYLNHFWSLCVEEQFYLVWPFIVFNVNTKRLPHVMIAIVLSAILMKLIYFAIGMTWGPIYTNIFTRMDAFALGGLAAYANSFWPRDKLVIHCSKIFYLSMALLVFYGVLRSGIPLESLLTQVAVTPIIAIFFALFIYLSINYDGWFCFVKRVLRSNSLRILGKYSYGIYIYHQIVFITIVRIDAFGIKISSTWLNFFLVTIFTLTMSLLSFHFIELPFLRLKKRLIVNCKKKAQFCENFLNPVRFSK